MEFTRASQVATGVIFHSSMITSQSWWMLETLRYFTFRLRMPHRLSLSPSLFSKVVVVLEVCLESLSCWNTALRPSLRREGIMLCFSMSQYMLAFMVPSMNCSSPVPAALMQPQTMTFIKKSYYYLENIFLMHFWLAAPLNKWIKFHWLGWVRFVQPLCKNTFRIINAYTGFT